MPLSCTSINLDYMVEDLEGGSGEITPFPYMHVQCLI